MLLSSTNKNEKIVLGLLCLTCKDDDTMTEASEILDYYRNHEDMELFLYKDPDTDNYVGLMGIEHRRYVTENEKLSEPNEIETILVNRISVIPSFLDEGVEYEMYKELRILFPNAQIVGVIQNHTQDLIAELAAEFRAEEDSENESVVHT
ncbi:hypothetical protein HZY91_01080 [Facklamia sp. DSM 111018]|uniref:Uncharacterized protein n=1 Tax=Facklamia lactis TaxID=2749967 RepID=A0ABS0LMV9_9LACT|nr:hypothetical protein [Facklamia lactis]MBG9979837.1 hypothetical protein [Facklamia lactis]MBG9985483.1 hypothetical protein [Facklamia lactis]